MKQLLLQPEDVLFFRDGRPMSGSLAGHGAAWPLPSVLSAALHAALHRAFVDQATGANTRGVGRSHAAAFVEEGRRRYCEREVRHFTDVWSVGPFPVKGGHWFFPRPADAQFFENDVETTAPTLLPARNSAEGRWLNSSLPAPLRFAVANTGKPTKKKPAAWWSAAAFESYLSGTSTELGQPDVAADHEFFAAEHNVGIAIDPATQTTGQGAAEGRIYSAHYLRLAEEAELGALAGDSFGNDATLTALFPDTRTIVVGGQQRRCTVRPSNLGADEVRLPKGLTRPEKLKLSDDGHKFLVKWVLLSPAVWPAISDMDAQGQRLTDSDGQFIRKHGGGWLPNWVAEAECTLEGEAVEPGNVLLLDGPGRDKARRRKLTPGKRIAAKLVAALVPKPLLVTGWALGGYADGDHGGAKSTHLAVPPGAVYYFEVDRAEGTAPGHHAQALLNALNWHGATDGAEIKNRRSTLFGEKGFGLGICGAWEFYGGK